MESPLPLSLPLPSGLTAWQPARPANSLLDQLLALRRRWRMILLATLLLPAATALVLSHTPPRYTATGILLYDPAGSAPPGDPLSPNVNALDQDAITASQGAIITSLPSARALAGRLDLAARPEFNPALRHKPWFVRLLGGWFARKGGKPRSDDVALAAQQVLDVSVLSGSRVLSVRVR